MSNLSLVSEHPHLAEARKVLLNHGIYGQVSDLESLRLFMQAHVFAVWDFMSLAKRLQRELTCVSLPWTPPSDPSAARLINEIVLGEESDEGPDGKPLSHLELYLAAMEEVQADSQQFRKFLRMIIGGVPLEKALHDCEVPSYVQAFVLRTLHVSVSGKLEEAMAYFFFGREDVIPEMFMRILSSLGHEAAAPFFRYYLKRHIELDADEHGPAAANILSRYIRGAKHLESTVVDGAVAAIQARVDFFTGVETELQKLARGTCA